MATTEETTGVRSAAELLARGRSVIDPALHRAVDTLPDSTRMIAGHHFGWWNERGEPVPAGGGTAIRPALALLAAEAIGGDVNAATPAALAVELVHGFSLLHDDVMDVDLTRRHRPTTWTTFGANAAILAGDALLTLAFDVLAATGHPAASHAIRRLSTAVQELVEGRWADVSFAKRTDVELPECLRMAERKTGALLGCACGIGALLGGGSAEQVERLQAFGERLGLAFQVVEDLLGIWGDPAVTCKPAHPDLRRRKKSLPVVVALTSGTSAGRELAELYGRDRRLSDAELVRAANLIDRAGGRTWCRTKADEFLTGALRELRSAAPGKRAATELAAVARTITRRDH